MIHFGPGIVAILPIVTLRHAQAADLPEIVAIYNASIPGRMATADTEPVTVASREAWFRDFDPLYPRTYWLVRPADFSADARLLGDGPCRIELTLVATR